VQPGTIIDGRFLLEVEHRRGGMGAVWRARDLDGERMVAVKILHGRAGGDQAQRFVREARLLAQLVDAGIVSHVAHGLAPDGAPYLAMEWLEGEDVAERLARQRLTLAESLTLVRAAARSLAVAHERGIVHRDVKPSNLFLRRGQVDDVVLLDLGIARPLAADDALTRTGAILGTPSYMAPEQAQGLADVDAAADVYSLGCVLYECLVGEPPFVGSHAISVLAKVLFEPTPRVRQRRPEVPADVDELVAQMLMRERTQRLADAQALRGALERLHDVEPTLVAAVPSSVPPSGSEQELVSVILALPGDGSGTAIDALDLTAFGAEVRALADGTSVVTLTHRHGAATDLAVRAARCAMRLRDGAACPSIVLATGRGISCERLPIGEAADRACELLRARGERRDGSIWLDDVTAGLLDARFRLAPVETGIVALDIEEQTLDPARPVLGMPTACVGREHELATLELMLRACSDESSPRAILVTALPGLGKTRLRSELVRRLRASGRALSLLEGQGDPIRTSSRFGLLGSALARRFGLGAQRAPDENRARLEAGVAERLPASERRRTAAFLGELCGVPFPAGTVPELDAAQRAPQQMSRQIELAWLSFLRAEAESVPVLLVLDDLQWSDAQSVALVGAALRELSTLPLLVLALARPELSELFPDLWRPRLARLPLGPLAPAAMTLLVQQVLRDRIDAAEARRMVSRADGNALYLEELIRAAASGRDAVPETIVAMLQARIKSFTPTLRQVLRAASVFGARFPVAGVEALLGGALGPDEVGRCLETLVEHEILEAARGDGRARASSFLHVLMRDAAYALFTSDDRTLAHRLAAEFLRDAGDDHAVIAAHYELGGRASEAVRHYVEAAELAYRRADHGAIQPLVQRGLDAGAAALERGVLRSIEAPTRLFLHDVEGAWSAARESLEHLPPRHRRRTQSLGTATFSAVQQGRADETQAFIDELYATEPSDRDRADYTIAVGYACVANIVVANRRASTRLLARIAQIDGQLGGDDLIARGSALFCRAQFLQFLGDSPYEAWSVAQHSAAQQRALGNRRLLSHSLLMVGEAARWLCSTADGLQAMREGVRFANETGEAVGIDYQSQFLVMLLAEHGPDDALDEARELTRRTQTRANPSGLYRGLGLAAHALLELREGELARAEVHARQARALLHQLGHRAFWPHADRVALAVLQRTGAAGAGALADEALATLAALRPLGHLELGLRLEAARAHLGSGRREDAVRGVGDALASLATRANKIPVAALRQQYLTAVPENAALRALGRELGVGDETWLSPRATDLD